MVRHQAVSQHPPAAPAHDSVAQDEKQLPVEVIVVDRLVSIAARGDVIRASGDL
jgi:hypothetical protein